MSSVNAAQEVDKVIIRLTWSLSLFHRKEQLLEDSFMFNKNKDAHWDLKAVQDRYVTVTSSFTSKSEFFTDIVLCTSIMLY